MSEKIRRFAVTLVFLGLVGAGSLARGQDGPPVPKPTAEHERLSKEVGTWDATVKSWMRGPDSEADVSQGVEVVKLMPGGLWVLSDFEGKFGDKEFHGRGQSGYDITKGKYVSTWIDSMTTELMVMEGTYDTASQTMTMYAKGTSPSGKAYESKTTSKNEGDDTRVFTMFMKSDDTKGQYAKLMEIKYKRRPK